MRECAVRALGVSGDARATAPLERMLQDRKDDVRHWAERALASLNC